MSQNEEGLQLRNRGASRRYSDSDSLNRYLDRHGVLVDSEWSRRRHKLGPVTDEQILNRFGKSPEPKLDVVEKVKEKVKGVAARPGATLKKGVKKVIPITEWLPEYVTSSSFKRNLIGDVISGFTVGVVALPQAMAYAFLANMPAVNGLFVQFFPVLAYIVFGTSRHISIGTFAVVSLMIGAVIDNHVPAEQCDHLLQPSSPSTDNFTLNATDPYQECYDVYTERKIQVSVALSVAVAIVHLLMFVFRLGIITVYLSSSLVSGFTCGASFHVMTSQVPKLFGIKVPRTSGPLGLIMTYVNLFKNIHTISWPTTIVSVCSIIFLVFGKEINARYGKRIPFPIPWELFVVIATTVGSNFGQFEQKYDIKTVGDIPTGFQTTVPIGNDIIMVLPDAFAIAIVAYFVSISLARLFATKHAYDIDSNQELLSLSIANIFGSFFACFPCASSLSRSVIMDEVGGITQIAALFQALVIFIVLMFIAPVFEPLPQSALAAIIIVNLKRLLRQFDQLPGLWRVSRLDVMVWLITWTAVVVLGVDMGLLVGVAFSLLSVAIRTQSVEGDVLVPVGDHGEEKVFRSSRIFQNTEPSDGQYLVFRFASPLYFANQERFKSQLASVLGFDPAMEFVRVQKNKKATKTKPEKKKTTKKGGDDLNGSLNDAFDNSTSDNNSDNTPPMRRATPLPSANTDSVFLPPTVRAARRISLVYSSDIIPATIKEEEIVVGGDDEKKVYCQQEESKLSFIILDMRACSFLDNDGVTTLKALYTQLDGLEIRLLLAGCKASVRKALQKGNFPPPKDDDDDEDEVSVPVFFISVEKCVHFVHLDLARAALATKLDSSIAEDEITM